MSPPGVSVPAAGAAATVAAVSAPERTRSARRSRAQRGRVFLPAFLLLAVTTVGASSGVLWLLAHLLPHVSAREERNAPVADVVELLKFGLVVGVSKWVQSV